MTARIPQRFTTASLIAAVFNADGYKQSHKDIFPDGTTRVLINWTNRSNDHMKEATHAVTFGLQAFIQRYLTEAWAPFFAADENEVCELFETALEKYFGPNDLGTDHIRALHKLQHLPLRICALREGTLSPMGVATLTVENTHDEFFWLPNYIETALSASIWHPSTVATIALTFRELMEEWAEKTGADMGAIDFQAHDFSMRGQTSIETAAAAGTGHLLSFLGTDSMPTLDYVDRYYPGDNGWVAASVPATEHSVMCFRGEAGELATFHRVLDQFPKGVVSAVADGYDYWNVLTEVLADPELHARIMGRDGKLVIRPDSGDPVDIICGTYDPYVEGDPEKTSENLAWYQTEKAAGRLTPEQMGSIEVLGDLFGYTVNSKGYKELAKVIGLIYGDGINRDRAPRIFRRLATKGWVSTSTVLGIGSYEYQLNTRDSLGSAVKATWALEAGQQVYIQKDPKTGGGGKKSARGRIAVFRDDEGELYQVDGPGVGPRQEADSLLQPVWEDGYFLVHQSLADVRATLKAERAARAARNKRRALIAA